MVVKPNIIKPLMKPFHKPQMLIKLKREHLVHVANVLSTSLAGWAIASYVKATILSSRRTTRGRTMLYSSRPMSKQLRQIIVVYHIAVFYYMCRVIGNGRQDSVYAQLCKIAANNLPKRGQATLALVSLPLVFDEMFYVFAVAALDGSRALHAFTDYTWKKKEHRQCCICLEYESDEDGTLSNYCTSASAHVSHEDCMMKWFTCDQDGRTTCPLCRSPLRTYRLPLWSRVFGCISSYTYWAHTARRLLLSGTAMVSIALLFRIFFGPRIFKGRPPIPPPSSRSSLVIDPALAMAGMAKSQRGGMSAALMI